MAANVEHGRTKCTNVLRPNRTRNVEHSRTDCTNVSKAQFIRRASAVPNFILELSST